ncbi:uncharacterized protein K452DRAFT_302012 [Aplosporella prunicola CBS 121167]|uniref:Uncharacterized protein n=1 Tax=Aplosporella prunicola CBS 121167 TaxID=1176127 RepID=A0A6A6B0Q5_9PEZI|nr:uncharacterized protein K452DRAFT_302012 [Aplosporella prunicola CBS 121167]KAF2137436.1 hypothetical protein K452DRAFT_302012 [Aplosporella prunicola CBS 121167]
MHYTTAVLALFAVTGLAAPRHTQKQMPWAESVSPFDDFRGEGHTGLCMRICSFEPIKCSEGWENVKMGECNTCCKSEEKTIICKSAFPVFAFASTPGIIVLHGGLF